MSGSVADLAIVAERKPDSAAAVKTPVVILGSAGYVGGELLRILAGHPRFEVTAAVSSSQAGQPIAATFPHLAGVLDDATFASADGWRDALGGRERWALLSAAPHGQSAITIAEALRVAGALGEEVAVVDTSADLRFPNAADWAEVYGHAHPVPSLTESFLCAVPEHWRREAPRRVAHPGCFTTAALLALVPLLALELIEPEVAITAITGSTGSGRAPSEKTHHPARRSNVVAYQALSHRHAPEMRALALAASGVEPSIAFVPLSGPQARGIYLTLHARLRRAVATTDLVERLARFYAASPFVDVTAEPPALTEVVGTNRGRLGVAASGTALAVTVAIDNLVKGAAGGAVQWLNRMHGFDETDGLALAGLGWF
jgi:N-acetyl-gamma-glutamyl-phosphate reductase common form